MAVLTLRLVKEATSMREANLVALLRMNLFTHRDLWTWLDTPFHGPPTVLIAAQAELALG